MRDLKKLGKVTKRAGRLCLLQRFMASRALHVCPILCLVSFFCGAQTLDCPRFFKLNIQNLTSVQSLSTPNARSRSATESSHNLLIESALKYPISLSGRTKIIGEFGYAFEEVDGLYSPYENDDAELKLHRFSSGVLFSHQFNEIWKFSGRTNVYSASNRFMRLHSRTIAFSQIALVQKSISSGEVGIGVYMGYNNRFTVLPVVQYQKSWQNGWLLDMLLPSSITVSKDITADKRVYLRVKGKTGNYFLNNQQFLAFDDSNYRRLSIHPVIGYEKQLTKWVGIDMQLGATIPIQSGLFQLDGNWVKIHDFNAGITPHAKIGFFLSFPD